METFSRRTTIDAPAAEVFAWHLRPGAFERLLAPGDGTRVVAGEGRIEDDSRRVTLSIPLIGPLSARCVFRHEGFRDGARFVDVMERGPFRIWRHEHLVEPVVDVRCILVDRISYLPPFGMIGSLLGRRMIRKRLDRMFEHRHAVTAADLAAHHAAGLPTLDIAVLGAATHPLGVPLTALLSTGGHRVASGVSLVGLPSSIDDRDVDVVVTLDGAAATVAPRIGDHEVVSLEGSDVDDPRRILAAIADVVREGVH